MARPTGCAVPALLRLTVEGRIHANQTLLPAGIAVLAVFPLLLISTLRRQSEKEHHQAASVPIDWTKVAAGPGSGRSDPTRRRLQGGHAARRPARTRSAACAIKPALALGSWVGFKQTGENQVVAMGDLVLLETKLGPVLRRATGGRHRTDRHSQPSAARDAGG